MTNNDKKSLPHHELCPVGETGCQWLDDLSRLREDNERLNQLVSKDPLTGLFNFRYFQQILDAEIQRTLRGERPTSLIMIDIDFFKAVNDQWGHEAGNVALKTAARVFKKALRQFDIVCRYGGEEFVVILPQTALPMAVRIANRLRENLEQQPVETDQGSFNITASFGVNIYQRDQQMTQESFVRSADHFLYQAKEQGRNQVCHPDFSSVAAQTSVTADERSDLFGKN